MGILITIGVIIVCVLTGSIIMIVTRRFRKTGLSVFGIIIFTLMVTCLWLFIPRHYDRNYLQKSSQWKNLTLRMYADSIGFYIGAIPGGIEISDPIFCKNFNSVTAENALKMGPLLRDLKTSDYDFSRADKIVDEAIEMNIRVRGHTLVWGKQSDMFKNPDLAAWLETFPEQERSNILDKFIENHITTVLTHFRGRVKIWDCVNETMSMYKPGKLENNVFLKYLGEEYIPRAFEIAHSVDPDLKLYLNEQFIGYTGKTADAFIDLVKKLKDNNVPIHGVGIQSHVAGKADTAITDLQDFIKRITDLGLEVEITELDARLRLFSGADDPYEAQGRYYARMLQSCINNPLCKGLTFWGFDDSNCWMDPIPFFFKPNEPYLFDKEMNPKPAFYKMYKTLKQEYENRISEF